MSNLNKPIWFNEEKKDEGDTNVVEINVGGKGGRSPIE